MQIFDSHSHYDHHAFDGDRYELLASLPSKGICGVLNNGTSVASSLQSVSYAQRFGFVYASAGIHPQDAGDAKDGDVEKIGEIAQRYEKVVAIGEIGLDYHYDTPSKETQLSFFERQLALSRELGLPVIIHDREAHADTLSLVKKYRPRGVFHCYSGSAETARELVSLGFYLGFTGAVTFKNNKKAAAVISSIPLERILIETDCPFMAPEPFRSQRSDSSMLGHVLDRIAQIRDIDPERAAETILQNTRELFGVK
jgi:TatD DNase family protein